MARPLILAFLLAAVFSFFVPAAQHRIRELFRRHPEAIWAVPFLLTAIFSGAAAMEGALSVKLALLVLGYTTAPAICARVHADFLAIMLLWLPLEFAAGAGLVPRPSQGFLHSVAYGIAILLGLAVFLGFRAISGMKYNLPRNARDLWLPLAAFAVTAPLLAALGVAIGFIPPPHWPVQTGGRMLSAVGIIFAATALPEEILFRALIQNLMMQRFGATTRTLVAASVIFGLAHLDNGPQPAPNWRYAILATIAGMAYGKVFQKASSITSSALLHTMVDWTKHFFF